MSARAPKAGRPRIPPRPAPEEAGADPRERIIRTAYELFTCHGLAAVGVDRIVAEAGVAKTTLYRHFHSKDDLIAEVIERHRQLWLRGWLEPAIQSHSMSPADLLLAVFDLFEDWFDDKNFQGCLFINSLSETHDPSHAGRRVSVNATEDVFVLLERLAIDANAREPKRLAQQIHLLMRGAIVASVEGHGDAVAAAREAARLLVAQAVPLVKS